MKITTFFLLFLLLFGLGEVAQSQNYNPLRVEFEPEFEPEKYQIVPAGKEQMIFFKETDEKPEWGERYWEATAYDGSFEETWNKKFPLDKNLNYANHKVTGEKLHIFFLEGDNPYKQFRIVSIDKDGGSIETVGKDFPEKLKNVSFSASEEAGMITGTSHESFIAKVGEFCFTFSCMRGIFGLTTTPHDAYVFHVDLNSHEVNALPQNYKRNSYGVRSNFLSPNIADVAIAHMPKNKTRDLYLKTYESQSLKEDKKIKTKTDNYLITAGSSKAEDNAKLVFGTYSSELKSGLFQGQTKYYGTRQMYDVAGVYISKFKDRRQDFIRYYSLDDFLEEDSRLKGEEVKFEIHEIIENDGKYFLLIEAYTPMYSTSTQHVSTSTGTTIRTTTEIDGYQPSKAITLAFDEDGKKLWANTMEIQKKEQGNIFKKRYKDFMDLDKTVTAKINEEGELVLIFADDGKIFNAVLHDGEVISQENDIPIPTKNEQDEVTHNYYTNLDHWYDNYYIAWGYQKVDKSNNGQEKLFYFNKIALEDQ